MAAYRTPLPGLLAGALDTAINRVLALDENSATRVARLQGKSLQLDLEGIGISLYFIFSDQRIHVRTASDAEPDTVVSGSPAALFSMAAPEGWGSAGSRVSMRGDANLARDLERLFAKLDPDWERGFSRLFGDVLGHQMASGLRSGAQYARETAGNTGEMVAEFLQREDGPLADRQSFMAFADSVDETRDAVERLQARIQRLREDDS